MVKKDWSIEKLKTITSSRLLDKRVAARVMLEMSNYSKDFEINAEGLITMNLAIKFDKFVDIIDKEMFKE